MKKLALLSTFLFICAIPWNLYADPLEEVVLEDVSTSGKTLIIDRGLLDKFEEGKPARFFVQKGPKEYPKVFLVAEGELVKSFPRKSYWVLKKIYIPDTLKRKSKILMLGHEGVLSGRALKVRRHHVVLSDEEYTGIDDFLDKNQTNVPSRFVKEGDAFEASTDVFERDYQSNGTGDSEAVVTTYETYQNKAGNYYSEEYGDLSAQRFFIGSTEVSLGDIKNADDKKLFESMTDNYVKKTNDMKYGIKGFYNEQIKMQEMKDMNIKISSLSMAEMAREKAKEDTMVDPHALAKYRRDKDQWSSDMSDVGLRRYFIQTGMESEARRRDLALNELEGHEFMFHYSNAFTPQENSPGDTNPNKRGYSLGIAYDFHMSRLKSDLKKWSVQVIYEKSASDYSTGVYNANSKESAVGAYLNYYFVNSPLTLNSFIYLAGVGIKKGSGTLTSSNFGKDYSTQVLALPALQLMTKYRFRSGDLMEENVNVGASVNLGINLDIKNITVGEQITDVIDSKISTTDLKYTVGMSLYF